jgi:hypothetical protein
MPEQYVPLDIEAGWLSYILGSTTAKCFAICLNFTDRPIGNIELTKISDHDAQWKILIGEKEFWGKGIATKAMQLVSEFAFSHLKLKQLYRISFSMGERTLNDRKRRGSLTINTSLLKVEPFPFKNKCVQTVYWLDNWCT